MVYDKAKSYKKRVTFADPEETKEHHLRLKSPAASARPASKGPASNMSEGKKKHEANHETVAPCSSSNHKSRSKHNVQKCFVRNTEMPVSKSAKNVRPTRTANLVPTRRPGILKNPLPPGQNISTDDTTGYTSKYSAPELYSSLSVAQQIRSAAEEHKKKISITDVPLFIKKQIDRKASSKHNIPFEERIFHDLVNLNVCSDEEIVGKDDDKSVSEDLEPSLADFHQLKSGEEYRHDYKPLPCNVEKVRRYNGLSVYNKMQCWENKT